jgi:uncharacterized protein (UPF0147 family)
MKQATEQDNRLQEIFDYFKELGQDNTVPRNVKNKLNDIVRMLNGVEEFSIKVNKAIDELDEICNDGNLQPYTRTQLWNVLTMLNSVDSQ